MKIGKGQDTVTTRKRQRKPKGSADLQLMGSLPHSTYIFQIVFFFGHLPWVKDLTYIKSLNTC